MTTSMRLRPSRYGQLLLAMTKRDLGSRFRGTLGGTAWIIVSPLLMLGIYTFVFSTIFRAHWNVGTASDTPFAFTLYAGLIVFTILSEPVSRAPTLIAANVNLVKRVVFPLEVLPLMAACSSTVIGLAQAGVLLCGLAIWQGHLPWTALLFPAILLPVVLLTLGLVSLIAALGVYLRDVAQATSILLAAAMFLSPVFYPVTAVPEWLQGIYQLNPLTISIEQARAVLLDGTVPYLADYARGLATSMAVAVFGITFFAWTKPGFADVL